MKSILKSKNAKLTCLGILLFTIISGITDYSNIKNQQFDKVCKYPSSKFTSIDGKDYNYCIGPLYYIRYLNDDGDMTIIPIDASDKIDMGLWLLPSITIFEK